LTHKPEPATHIVAGFTNRLVHRSLYVSALFTRSALGEIVAACDECAAIASFIALARAIRTGRRGASLITI
jgi:hypothetical protein